MPADEIGLKKGHAGTKLQGHKVRVGLGQKIYFDFLSAEKCNSGLADVCVGATAAMVLYAHLPEICKDSTFLKDHALFTLELVSSYES